jgi:hypothetical protein
MVRKPAITAEPWGKVTVVLFNRQVKYLDDICLQIRRKHGKAIARSDLIQAIVDAFARQPQEKVEGLIVSRLGYNPRRNLK